MAVQRPRATTRTHNRPHSRAGSIGRTALASAIVALGVAATPVLTGCAAAPVIAEAAIRLCPVVMALISKHGVETLPPGYSACGSKTWKVRTAELRFCFYCGPDPGAPILVQLECSGRYFPITPPRLRMRETARDSYADEIVHISKLECSEYLLAIAQAEVDEHRTRADATIIVPNDRLLPDARPFRNLGIEVDGHPVDPDGSREVGAGSALRIRGAFDEVTRYAAEAGVRSIEFRDGGAAWSIEVNPDLAVAAVFKNAQFIEARFLFSPGQP